METWGIFVLFQEFLFLKKLFFRQFFNPVNTLKTKGGRIDPQSIDSTDTKEVFSINTGVKRLDDMKFLLRAAVFASLLLFPVFIHIMNIFNSPFKAV